jgi:hypothetical protein
LRQQDKQAAEINFREVVEPEVFALFLSPRECRGGDFGGLLPVPKVKTEMRKISLSYRDKTSFLPFIAASLL